MEAKVQVTLPADGRPEFSRKEMDSPGLSTLVAITCFSLIGLSLHFRKNNAPFHHQFITSV